MPLWPSLFALARPIRGALRQGALAFFRSTAAATATIFDVYFAYRLLADREPTPGELAQWQVEVDGGRVSRAALVDRLTGPARAGETVLDLGGYVMSVDADDPMIGRSLALTRQLEPNVTTEFRRWITPDSAVLDIGANMGWFTLLAAHLAPHGHVIAVEAHPGNVRLIETSVAANAFAHVDIWPVAAVEQTGLVDFATANSNGYIPKAGRPVESIIRRVPGVALDALLADVARLDVVKIDIEGFEPYALRGMRTALERWRPVIFCEFHPWIMRVREPDLADRYLQFLRDLGYRLDLITRDTGVLADQTDGQIWDHWRVVNAQMGSADGIHHLDLLARPAARLQP